MYAVHNEQIRLSPNQATRLIAQRLRDAGKSPAEANDLAAGITTALIAATPAPKKPGLQSWRMIPPAPTASGLAKLAHLKDHLLHEAEAAVFGPTETIHRVWQVVYDEGAELPEDVGMTDT